MTPDFLELAHLARLRGSRHEAAIWWIAADLATHLGPDSNIPLDLDRVPAAARPDPPVSTEVGTAALDSLRQVYDFGFEAVRESMLASLPRDLRHLVDQQIVDLDDLADLHEHTGAVTRGDFGLLMLPSPDEATLVARVVADALPALRATEARISLGRAWRVVEPIRAALLARPSVADVIPLGSLRRAEPTIGDLDLLVLSDDPADVLQAAAGLHPVTKLLYRTDTRASLRVDNTQIDLRVVPASAAASILLTYTGPPEHLSALQRVASARGLELTRHGLRRGDGTLQPADREDDLYRQLGMPYIVPELRQGTGEVEAAERGELPVLVERADLRGDMHLHTSWSDGRDSIEAMVRAARDLGLEYVAVTDHSERAGASRTLRRDQVKRQADAVAEVRQRYPEIQVLHGCEVDIMPDGSLDFPDAVLESLDLVLASLHDDAGQGPARLFERYLQAMRHPLVDVITHPTNRLLPGRLGYPLDYRALFDGAVATGTALEIDGSPVHLDLDGGLARRAVAQRVPLIIDSDCHRADMLDRNLRFGIATARRGWVEASHVLNTGPLAAVLERLSRKRAAAGLACRPIERAARA